MRDPSATQLPMKAIVVPVGKSNSVLDLQTVIIFGNNGGVKINKYLDHIESLVIGRNLKSNTP